MGDECRRFRRHLAAGSHVTEESHSCDDCERFARRWAAIERELAATAEASPPPGFIATLRSRLPRPAHPVVTMALKALPAILALLLALGIWVATNPVGSEPAASADDYLAWVLQDLDPDREAQ